MPSLAEDLAARAAPLEYWFVKLHADGLAFLVDLIVRRAIQQAEVRVSLWVHGRGRVARAYATDWREVGSVTIAGSQLGVQHTAGAVDDIEWSLTYDAHPGRAAPKVPLLGRLHPFDLELISRPQVSFAGQVSVGGERFEVAAARGCVTHYWGRRLSDRWHWISANAFDDGDLTVEAVAMVTRLWGARPSMAAGYLWMREDGRERVLISPLDGLISLTGDVNDYTLVARRPGRTTRLRCSAAAEVYNDLGEGIHQTLHGSCSLVARGMTDTRAGLEYRIRPGS
jgi:hypothetical protein